MADETLLLDILANADNNVQKASEELVALGYVRKDFAAPPKLSNRPQHDEADCAKQKPLDGIKIIPLRPKEYTEEEKEGSKWIMKMCLCKWKPFTYLCVLFSDIFSYTNS